MIRSSFTRAALGLALAPTLLGQPTHVQSDAVLNAADEAHRQARIALTGDLGFAPLPAVRADSPTDSMFFADRRPVGQGAYAGSVPPGTYFNIFLNAATTGTGFFEVARGMTPHDYVPGSADLPLVVAYHGFGSSAQSVADQSLIDEECNERGYLYLSVTGIDDQLFGAPLVQQNVDAAIEHMIANYDVDEDRIFMVGFSMGGGIVSNYAARHRDPDDIMIAGVGTVSATLDWTMEYNLASAALQSWFENQYNFGDTPSVNLFEYQQASALYHDEASYPPTPGTVLAIDSMSTNLQPVPTYITYDVDDTLTQVPDVNDAHKALLDSLGVTTQIKIQTGTVDPDTLLPAPHSWAVLDAEELFDFFDAAPDVDRFPVPFEAQIDVDATVSCAEVTKVLPSQFARVDLDADGFAKTLTIDGVSNVDRLVVDVAEAGIRGTLPVHVTATSADVLGFTLELEGFMERPCYLLDTLGGLVTAVDSDIVKDSLIVDIPAGTTLEFDVIHDPEWTTDLSTSPNPAPLGSTTTVSIDGPVTSGSAYYCIAISELLTPVKGVVMTAFPGTPAILVLLPLDSNGDVSFPITVPTDHALAGIRIPTQVVTLDGSNALESVSNNWGLRLD